MNPTMSEETPLLNDIGEALDIKRHEAVYDRFSKAQKRVIVALISMAGLVPLFVSGTFIPSIPQIARDLKTTGSVVNLAVSLSILSNAVGSLVWATYSSFYGRRPIYLVSIACQCVGSFGVASSKTIPELMFSRFFQAFGASSGLSVGIGVIGDIYKLEERGAAAGIFFGAVLLGPTLSPLIAGLAAHYYSWRIMQYGMFVYAILSFVLVFWLQPETSQPGARGVDKMIELEGRARWVCLNPFRSLSLLRSPNISLLALAGAFVLITDYVLLVPLAFTLGKKYNITNEALIGALCIPVGIGNFIGAPLSGMISDRMVLKWRKIRGDKWVPEDRLRATTLAALIFVPCSVLFVGLLTEFVPGKLGLYLNIICLFFNGLGVDFMLSPAAAYNVDILHHRSAEVTAANMALRNLVTSITVSGILPSINHFGVGITNGISATLAWIGFVFIWLVIRYGDRMRAYVDIGYSTLKDN